MEGVEHRGPAEHVQDPEDFPGQNDMHVDDQEQPGREGGQAGAPAGVNPAGGLPVGAGAVPMGVSDETRAYVIEALGPVSFAIAELWVRRASPVHLRASLTPEQCLERFQRKWADGELQEHADHMLLLPERERGQAVSQETFAFPCMPTVAGQKLPPELLALVGEVAADRPARTSRESEVLFKPSVPTPDLFYGPKGGGETKAVWDIAAWISSVESIASLLRLTAERGVGYAARFLRGDAQSWWLGWNGRDSCTTFEQLRAGLTARFVSADPFEVLCDELKRKTLVSFSTYDAFKAWWVQTVAAMRSYAEAGRMWPDTVLIDQLLLALRGTLYHETVVVDPESRVRPATLEHALRLMDDRHRVLQARQQAHGQTKGKASGDVAMPTAPAEFKAGSRRADKRAEKRKRQQGDKAESSGTAAAAAAANGSGGGKQTPQREHLPKAEYLAKKFKIKQSLVEARLAEGTCVKCGHKHTFSGPCPTN